MNQEYTDLWLKNFNQESVCNYHSKFFTRWEKNIKHREQINLIKKYFKYDIIWCDCPIGSGRLMDELKSCRATGIDLSDEFLEYNRKKGITCLKRDLFDLNIHEKFELITCIHTLFAFDRFRDIIAQECNSLKPGGILIMDLVNQSHLDATRNLSDKYSYNSGVSRNDILKIAETHNCEVIEIIPHDFWDNRFILHWRSSGSPGINRIKRIIWNIINVIYFEIPIYGFLMILEKLFEDRFFTKYLVVMRKIS